MVCIQLTVFFSISLLLPWTLALPTTPCNQLSQFSFPLGGRLQLNATSIAVGGLDLSALPGETGVSGTNNVSFCRVMGRIAYGRQRNDTLNFELWLPDSSDYNERYLSVGNGGFAGSIDYATMLTNLNDGFAVGGCDSGHSLADDGPSEPGGYVQFLNDRDEALAWIHNSIAMFTEPAKTLTSVYYQRQPKKVYYYGCSTGGAQGFALAQFHPDVFDGIYAGSPGNYYSHLILSFLWNGLNSNASTAFLDQDALNFITNAAVAQCDEIDGVKDGVIGDPRKCPFSITSLECADNQANIVDNSTACLTSDQVANVEKFYSGPKDSRTGASVYPRFAVGSETEWIPQETILYLDYGVPILQNLVFKNLNYDYTKFNWGSDVDAVDQTATPLISEISPNLQAFRDRGGKLMVTQGWADPYNAPGWPIQQHDEMFNIFGDQLSDFYSLFMVPGGGHCGGASNYPQVPGIYHVLDRLIPWVEEDQTPQDVLATTPADGSSTTRKLCPYPKEAVYVSGDESDWTSYTCE